MPYTTVVAGTVITASWGNANVRDQVVTPFANAGTRDATILLANRVEGMLECLTDADELTMWDGTQWVTPGPRIVGTKYATGGTLATSAAAETAMTAWTGGDATVDFLNLHLYRLDLEIGATDAGAAGVAGIVIIKIRRTVNSTAAAILGQFQAVTGGNNAVASKHFASYVYNASGATVSASLGLTVTKSIGGDAKIYGDATGLPCILTVTHLGLSTNWSSLSTATVGWPIT